jgi:predicted transcriptional regulator
MKLFEVKDILQATVLTCEDQLDKTVPAAGGADIMSDILAAAAVDSLFLTGNTSLEVIDSAVLARVGAVMFVRGKRPDDSVIAMAERRAMPLLLTPFSMFIASGRLYMHGMRGLEGSW